MKFAFLCICFMLFHQSVHSQEYGPFATFIQTNLIGFPVIHDKQTWIFDPDISKRRRKEFIAEYGDKGEKLVEKLGLGIDGYAEERLRKQQLRDEGHLGGLNAYLP